jgi:predicted enzyme related to lactoylglutathione lyase
MLRRGRGAQSTTCSACTTRRLNVWPPDPCRCGVSITRCGGWTFEAAFADTDLNADYWIIRSSDNGIGGPQRSASSARPHAGTRLYVEAADLEETLGRVQALGGRVERGRTALGGDNRWFATVLDPTGVALACGPHAQPWQLSPTTTLTHRIGLRTACPDRPPRTFIQVRPTCGKCGWF